MRLFLDASALTKSYIPEAGTATIVARCEEAEVVVLSVLAAPEVISAFNRLRREGKLSQDDYEALKKQLAEDLKNSTIVALTQSVIDKSIQSMERAPLRASDAIHIASAMEAAPDRFLSGDRRQCAAARLMGLTVEYAGTQPEPAAPSAPPIQEANSAT